MSKFYDDIISQPEQLIKCLNFHLKEGAAAMQEAASTLRFSKHVFISGIGASWNAGVAIQFALNQAGIPAILCDASEFLHFLKLPLQSVVIFLSRSGKSIEIVSAIGKCTKARAHIIAITNDIHSPLGKASDIVLDTHVTFDHAISVNTYSSIVLTGLLLAGATGGHSLTDTNVREIEMSFAVVSEQMEEWNSAVHSISWQDNHYFFLARGADLAAAHESKLLWEEAAKYPAVALSTGAFRHGTQEVISERLWVTMWLQEQTLHHDLQLARDLKKNGAQVLLLGSCSQQMPDILSIHISSMPLGLNAVINTIPMQLAAEAFCKMRSKDCDRFRYCQLVVEKEGGL